jgi:hypothetical protein
LGPSRGYITRTLAELSTTDKLFEKVVLKIVQRHIEEKGLLNASQFGFRARHSTALQCMRLTDHVALNFNSNMSTVAVFLDIEKAFDTTWHLGLLYKLSTLQFSISLIKLIGFSSRIENSEFQSKVKYSRCQMSLGSQRTCSCMRVCQINKTQTLLMYVTCLQGD